MSSTLFPQQQPAETLHRIERYLARDPDNPDLLANAIDLHLAQGNVAAARAHANDAMTRYPHDSFFLHRHGNVLLAEGRLAEAEAVFRGLMAVEDHAVIAYNLAYSLFFQRRFAEACDILAPRMYQDEVPTDMVLLHTRSLHQLGDIRQALGILLPRLENLGVHPEMHALASLLHLDNDEVDAAERLLTAAVAAAQDAPLPLEALIVRGWLALARNELPSARADFDRVLATCPMESRSRAGAALISMMEEDPGVATERPEAAKLAELRALLDGE
jgi:predicted Zn-dependent protease